MITKSKYVSFITCPRLYYLNEYKSEVKTPMSEFQEMIIEDGNVVGDLARSYFGPYTLIKKESNIEMASKTKEAILNNNHIICEASFIYEDLFCAVDVLKVDSDGVEIYEVKSTTHDKDTYFHDVSFQNYVLTSLGYNVKGVYLLYINNKYVFKDKLDLKQYFNKLEMKLATKLEIESNLKKIREIDKEPSFTVLPNCKTTCPYFKYCFKDLPKNNIYNLAGLTNKYKLYKDGIITYSDYKEAPLKPTKTRSKCLEQIDYEENDKGIKIDKKKVLEFMNTLTFPIYYLDFETIRDVIPFINNTSPEFTRVIQYSLHIEESLNAPLIHKEYLQESRYDNLEEVIDMLINDLGTTGTILTYNQSFEKGRIEELANLTNDPIKHDKLISITNRIKDLQIPFKNRSIYCKEMYGRSTIKFVLPALCKASADAYHDLPLAHNGTDAMTYFNELMDCKDDKRRKEIKKGLLLYCGLDTMAMVDIVKRIRELLGDNN